MRKVNHSVVLLWNLNILCKQFVCLPSADCVYVAVCFVYVRNVWDKNVVFVGLSLVDLVQARRTASDWKNRWIGFVFVTDPPSATQKHVAWRSHFFIWLWNALSSNRRCVCCKSKVQGYSVAIDCSECHAVSCILLGWLCVLECIEQIFWFIFNCWKRGSIRC